MQTDSPQFWTDDMVARFRDYCFPTYDRPSCQFDIFEKMFHLSIVDGQDDADCPKKSNQFKDINRHTLYTGMIYGLGAATFWGSSNVFVKLGLENSGSPIAGSLIAYTAASFAISISLFIDGENKREILNKDNKLLKLAILIGITTCMAHLLRYLALGYGSVIIISLMLRTQSIWILLFSFIFNRKYESFSIWVILANALVIIGTILILIPSG